MRNTILFLLLIFFSDITVMAQMTSGHVTSSITVEPEEEVESKKKKKKKTSPISTSDTYFDTEYTRVETNNGDIKYVIITHLISGEVLILTISEHFPKMATLTSLEEIMASNSPQETTIAYQYDTETIAGYDCKKATVIDEDGEETVFWYTNEIIMENKQTKNHKGIDGYPMKYTVKKSGLVITFEVTSVEELNEDKSKIFNMDIPEGYSELTYEEFLGKTR